MRDTLLRRQIIFLLSFVILCVSNGVVLGQTDRYRDLVEESTNYIRKYELKKAEEILQSAIKFAPEKKAAYFILGHVKMMQHDWGEAKKVFKTIIQTDPRADSGPLSIGHLRTRKRYCAESN